VSELPGRPNIDQLHRQARELLRAAADGEPAALARVRAFSERVSLSAAQLAMAREYGFASWPALHAEVERRRAELPPGEGEAGRAETGWSFGGASPIETVAGRDTEKTLPKPGEQLDQTLKAQSEQLDRTLAEQRTRTLNERFDTVAGQLSSDKPPAVRMAGVYAMAALADDWQDHRQMCVDVLCAYLRMPYEPEPGDDAPVEKRLALQASREVRHTVIRVITAHLNGTVPVSWCGLNFDFAGAVFDGGDFSGAKFSSGAVNFSNAKFPSGKVNFAGAEFPGGKVNFAGANFSGARVNFFLAKFSGAMVDFAGAKISGGTVSFDYAGFSGGPVNFSSAKFSGAAVHFFHSKFAGESPEFAGAEFSGGMVFFHAVEFSGGTVSFSRAEFSSETVDFTGAGFSGGTVDFSDAEFRGGSVRFAGAEFSGGTVDFGRVAGWTQPPDFGSGFDVSHPPAGVMLPTAASPSPDSPVP
jgi:uncharacterized protein YjbI with pentapeptide repeats